LSRRRSLGAFTYFLLAAGFADRYMPGTPRAIQQPGPPPPEAIATVMEGGQLMAVRTPACAEATDAAVPGPPAAQAGVPM